MKKLFLIITFLTSLISANIVVEDIRIVGLQRVSLGSVLDTIPVTIGDRISSKDYQRIIRTLFSTGQFDDIQLSAEENILFVKVEERPTISGIAIDGNSAIETPDLLGALAAEGVSEGSVLKRATLDMITKGLQAQYSQQGRYGASVDVEQKQRPRNRVEINIEIDEGSSTAIASIEIIGNESFSDEDLKKIFDLSLARGQVFFSTSDMIPAFTESTSLFWPITASIVKNFFWVFNSIVSPIDLN